MAIDSQHRFEADFAGKIHDVTHKTEPIVFVNVRPIAINECRLAAFVSARHCWSSHWLRPFALIDLGGWEAAGEPPPLLRRKN